MSWLAGFAIAMHAILAGFVLPGVTAPVDPFSVICHSTAGGAPDDGRGHLPGSAPSQSCDHCKLCTAAAAPVAPDVLLDSDLAPSRLLQVLYPVSIAPSGGIAITPKLARGPPTFA